MTEARMGLYCIIIIFAFALADMLVGYILLSNSIPNRYCNDPIYHQTPTLTGEYGQPDGWETLTGPYVE